MSRIALAPLAAPRSSLVLAMLATAMLSVLAGFVLAAGNGPMRLLAVQVRGQLRQSLGLPKNWVEPTGLAPADRASVACPDADNALVVVTGGQSNAANSLSGPLIDGGPGQVFTFADGACFPGIDPVPGVTGRRASLWPDLGRRLAATTGRPVVFINGAVGGSQVGDWTDPRSGYLARLRANVAAARARGLRPAWIVWHHGETDSRVHLDPADFAAAFDRLLAGLLDLDPDATLYLFQASRCGPGSPPLGTSAITAAERAVGARYHRVQLGLDTDVLDDDYRWDGCHFNSRGREFINSRLAAALVAGAPASPSRVS